MAGLGGNVDSFTPIERPYKTDKDPVPAVSLAEGVDFLKGW